MLGSSENALTCGYATPAGLLAENVFAGPEGWSLLAKTTVYQGFWREAVTRALGRSLPCAASTGRLSSLAAVDYPLVGHTRPPPI